MFYFVLLFSLSAFGALDSRSAFEKSYPRDNTFCTVNGKRVEFIIRGGSKFTEANDKGVGEYLFARLDREKVKLLSSNDAHFDTFSLFKGKSSLCSKSFGFPIGTDTMAVLFLKENRPFKSKLAIQFFDLKKMSPKYFLDTNYPTDSAKQTPRGFAFSTYDEEQVLEFGKVTIEGEAFIYQEKEFPRWIEYSSKGFNLLPELTFEQFPWKTHFKNQQEFFDITEWNAKEKKFGKTIIYLAVNHKLKKQCFLFVKKVQKLLGTESWRCQAM